MYPLTIAANAKPIPVLPDVPSIIVPPSFNNPWVSASSIILSAILSLVELPGLKVSYFAKTKHGNSFVNLFSLTRGVLPIVPNIFSKYSINYIFSKIQSHLINYLKK